MHWIFPRHCNFSASHYCYIALSPEVLKTAQITYHKNNNICQKREKKKQQLLTKINMLVSGDWSVQKVWADNHCWKKHLCLPTSSSPLSFLLLHRYKPQSPSLLLHSHSYLPCKLVMNLLFPYTRTLLYLIPMISFPIFNQ